MLVPDPDFVNESAKRRLNAIENLTELGAGFALANHDLEIRGAGELLGEGQSGIIEEIGFSMYTDFLNRAIRDLSGQNASTPVSNLSQTEVDTEASAYIPESFIPDVHARLMLYQRISDCEDESSLYELKLEIIDRFGLLPPETKMLFHLSALRAKSSSLGIKQLRCGSRSGQIVFHPGAQISPERFSILLTQYAGIFSMKSPIELSIRFSLQAAEQRATFVEWILNVLDEQVALSPLPQDLMMDSA